MLKSLKLNGDIYPLTVIAELYTLQGRINEAEKLLLKAGKSEKLNVRFYIALGDLRLHQNRFGDAEASLRKALELDSKKAYAHWVLGEIFQSQGRFTEALECFQMSSELNPDDIYIKMYRKTRTKDEDLFKDEVLFDEDSYKKLMEGEQLLSILGKHERNDGNPSGNPSPDKNIKPSQEAPQKKRRIHDENKINK